MIISNAHTGNYAPVHDAKHGPPAFHNSFTISTYTSA